MKLKSVSFNKTFVVVNTITLLSKFLADFIQQSRETTQRETNTEGQLGIAAIALGLWVFLSILLDISLFNFPSIC